MRVYLNSIVAGDFARVSRTHSNRLAGRQAPDLTVELLGRAGLNIRIGTHTGEVDLAEANAGGMAAAVADKLADLAEENQVIASRTVKDLVAGSGIEFEPRGAHELKGIPGEWNLFSVGRLP